MLCFAAPKALPQLLSLLAFWCTWWRAAGQTKRKLSRRTHDCELQKNLQVELVESQMFCRLGRHWLSADCENLLDCRCFPHRNVALNVTHTFELFLIQLLTQPSGFQTLWSRVKRVRKLDHFWGLLNVLILNYHVISKGNLMKIQNLIILSVNKSAIARHARIEWADVWAELSWTLLVEAFHWRLFSEESSLEVILSLLS